MPIVTKLDNMIWDILAAVDPIDGMRLSILDDLDNLVDYIKSNPNKTVINITQSDILDAWGDE